MAVIGATTGMLDANVPAVLVGDLLANAIAMNPVHSIAARILAVPGWRLCLASVQGRDFAYPRRADTWLSKDSGCLPAHLPGDSRRLPDSQAFR
jgi:hypothetical protein